MKKLLISSLLMFLVVMLPVCFADSFTYDANGNLVTGDGKYREYDGENHLVKIRDGNNASGTLIEEYIYDHTGARIITIDHNNSETIYTPTRDVMKIVNSSGEYDYSYIYDGDTLVARKDHTSGEVQYYHSDHLGSTNLISDENGQEVETTFYKPFGGSDGSTASAETRVGYTGHELDEGTGQIYMKARYYSPDLRIFTQPDTLLPDIYDPQQLNRYSYARNNPYRYVDPDGHNPLLLVVGYIGVRGLIGGFRASIGDAMAQNRAGASFSLGRFGKQFMKGFGKGVVIGTTEVAIVAAGVLLAPVTGGVSAVAGVGVASFVGEVIIENAWDISYKEEDEEIVEDPLKKDEDAIIPEITPPTISTDVDSGGPNPKVPEPQNNGNGGGGSGSSGKGGSWQPWTWWDFFKDLIERMNPDEE